MFARIMIDESWMRERKVSNRVTLKRIDSPNLVVVKTSHNVYFYIYVTV